MSNLISLIPSNAICCVNGEPKTNSMKVAEAFGKRHDDVLRKLKSLDCSEDFTARNFAVSEYKDSSGRKLPLWEMTKDGFMFLVMGFTGKKAAAVKEAFINKFNELADRATASVAIATSRVMLTIENGAVVNSSVVPNDAFVANKQQIISLIQEPGIFTLDEVIEISEVAGDRIINVAKHRLLDKR